MSKQDRKTKPELVHCNHRIPRDIYRKFRLIAADKAIPIQDLYSEAAREYVEQHWPEHQTATKQQEG